VVSRSRAAAPAVAPEVLLVLGIALVAVNLRASITIVGPIVADIRDDLGLSSAAAGLLTTLPVLAFAVGSPFAVRIGRRVGVERTLAGAMTLLVAGILLRVTGPVWAAFAGTAMLGLAIAAGNVLLPGLVKRDLPRRVGPVTSIYVTVMVATAGVASAVAVPLAEDLGLGWRGTLAVWAVPAAAALVFWLPRVRASREEAEPEPSRDEVAPPRLRRSWLAWQVTAFMGLQSFVFYVLVAWLSDLLHDSGVSAARAGLMVGLLQATSLIATITIPTLAARMRDQRLAVALCCLIGIVGCVGLLIAPGELALLWVVLVGPAGGATLSLALVFFALRTSDSREAAALSGMAQSLGYGFAAAGPFLVGALHDATGSWSLPVVVLIVGWVLTGVAGLLSGRARVVE
jgi:MFS transporter, CP family, cyanate transporter